MKIEPQRAPGEVKIDPWRVPGPLGGFLAALEGFLGLLLESWRAPAAVWEASWSVLERSWRVAPGAILGANWEPKGRPMEVQEAWKQSCRSMFLLMS